MCTCIRLLLRIVCFGNGIDGHWRMPPCPPVGRTILTCSLPVRNTAHPYSGIKTLNGSHSAC